MEQKDIQKWEKLDFIPDLFEKKLRKEGKYIGSKVWGCMDKNSDINIVITSKKGDDQINHTTLERYGFTSYPTSQQWVRSALFYVKCRFTHRPIGVVMIIDEGMVNTWYRASDLINKVMGYDETSFEKLSENKALRTEIFIRFLYLFGLKTHIPTKTIDFLLDIRQKEKENKPVIRRKN
jgi:hypothetical protein